MTLPTDDTTDTPVAPETTPKTRDRLLILVALTASAVAIVLAALPLFNQADFGTRVRAYLLANPDVLTEVVAARDQKAESDRTGAMTAAARANPALLQPIAGEPVFGPADARVTVVQYFDYRCPYCKSVAPAFLELMQAHPEVRFVFREWPILDQDGPPVSQLAARAAIAAHRQGKYLAVHQALMAERALDQAGVEAILRDSGVDMARAETDLTAPDTSRLLADIMTGAGVLRITGTPSFFINGQPATRNDPDTLNRMIEAAKAR